MDYYTTPPRPSHVSRSSLVSLYDLLADLDENQIAYLIQDLNHTTTQNMAVSQAVSAWSTTDPTNSLTHARQNMQRPTMDRSLSRTQKIRLSLQTIFKPSSHSSRRGGPQSTVRSRTSPAYKRISRPVFNLPSDITIADLQALLRAEFLSHPATTSELNLLTPSVSSISSSSSPSSPGSRRMRRYPSTIDMALEHERGGLESLGLGLLEPRPCTPIAVTPSLSRAGLKEPVFVVGGESPPVLDGIFEVMGSR